MTLEDEVKQLMYYRDKIKEYKHVEEMTRNKIIEYLKNHGQDGVIFKHKNRHITLMVETTQLKKGVTLKEREKKVHNILYNAGITDVDNTAHEIIQSLKSLSIVEDKSKDKLKVKTTKK
ncbi:hypothetical protein DH26_gp047 [Chloriridovirus anopheles1]|uniref:Uncharacterized protein n=1 Tax=Chloriridovirus anopheles1 TaxID=1465751 RepID=W8QRD3_9VIRU|nr:hypothetical protein DH26_gp047 [Anopheles minimus iridovirus]AHL67542.1 hypothetical protein AMIV_047 [Anopheles minimus iridovirus]